MKGERRQERLVDFYGSVACEVDPWVVFELSNNRFRCRLDVVLDMYAVPEYVLNLLELLVDLPSRNGQE